jgi:hypothetical protein
MYIIDLIAFSFSIINIFIFSFSKLIIITNV